MDLARAEGAGPRRSEALTVEPSAALAIVGATPEPLARPIRVARWQQALALTGADEVSAERWPALVAAACALCHGVPRVLLAPALEQVPEDVLLVVAPGELDPAARAALLAARAASAPPLALDLPQDAAPGDLEAPGAGPSAGVYWCAPAGELILPGRPRGTRCGPAALAAPLLLRAVPRLGPIAALEGRPPSPELVAAGAVALVADGRGRVTLAAGAPLLARSLEPAPAAPRGPVAELEAALEALAQRRAFRLPPGPPGWKTLHAEARRILDDARRAGRIASFELSVGPHPDAPNGAKIEAVVKLPRRVEQVVVSVRAV